MSILLHVVVANIRNLIVAIGNEILRWLGIKKGRL